MVNADGRGINENNNKVPDVIKVSHHEVFFPGIFCPDQGRRMNVLNQIIYSSKFVLLGSPLTLHVLQEGSLVGERKQCVLFHGKALSL